MQDDKTPDIHRIATHLTVRRLGDRHYLHAEDMGAERELEISREVYDFLTQE